jgi:hypothetical protein
MTFFTSNWYIIFICVFVLLMSILMITRIMRARKYRRTLETTRITAMQAQPTVYARPVSAQYAQPVQYAPQPVQYAQPVAQPVHYAQPVSPSMGQPYMFQQAVNMDPSAPMQDPIYRR